MGPEPEPVAVVDPGDAVGREEELAQVLPAPAAGQPAMLAQPVQVDQGRAGAPGSRRRSRSRKKWQRYRSLWKTCGAVERRGDLGHLGDQRPLQARRTPARVERRRPASGIASCTGRQPVSSATIRKLCRPPTARSARRPRRPRGRRSPSARARSRWAHSAEAGECLPRRVDQGRQPRSPGELVVPLQVDRQRPRGRVEDGPGPSTALAWRGAGRGSPGPSPSRRGRPAARRDAARRARSSASPGPAGARTVPWRHHGRSPSHELGRWKR